MSQWWHQSGRELQGMGKKKLIAIALAVGVSIWLLSPAKAEVLSEDKDGKKCTPEKVQGKILIPPVSAPVLFHAILWDFIGPGVLVSQKTLPLT